MLEQIAAIIREGDFFAGRRNTFAEPNNTQTRKLLEEHPPRECVEWQEGRDTYAAEFSVLQSPKLVVFKCCCFKNDEPTTLCAIKNSYRRLIARQAAA